MSDQPIPGSLLGVAPSVAMGRGGPLLPRRRLGSGSLGHGSSGRAYRLLAPLDKGGMGELYLAEVSAPGRPIDYVVVKRLLASLLDDEKYVAMFRSEAQVMAQLNHPNIVAVYDTPIVDHAQCLALEYVRGRSAQQVLSRCEDDQITVPPRVAVTVIERVLRGLHYAHNYTLEDGRPLDLVHRDVSPGNVLISFDNEVKLTDFGIAKSQMSMVSTTVGIVKGKARYLAPEQILGDPATPRSDVFSAAAVVSELLTGIPTFDQATVPKTLSAIVNDQRTDLASQLDFRCPELIHVLDKALHSKAEQRWANAEEFADALLRTLKHLPPGPENPGAWLAEMFSFDDDPLSEYLARDGIIPRARLSSTEAATEHGFQAASPAASAAVDAQTKINERHYSTEVISRPVKPGDELKTKSGDDDDEPIMSQRGVDEALSEMAFVQAQNKRLGAADPTAVVRARGVAEPRGADQRATAISMEAAPPAVKKPRPRPRDETPYLAARSRSPTSVIVERSGMPRPLVLLVGIAVGVGATLIAQAIVTPPAATTQKAPQRAEVTQIRQAPLEPLAETAAREPLRVDEVTVGAVPADNAEATLTVKYPKGARVYLDEEIVGSVPVADIPVSPGKRSVSVIKGKYRRRYSIEVQPGARYVVRRKEVDATSAKTDDLK